MLFASQTREKTARTDNGRVQVLCVTHGASRYACATNAFGQEITCGPINSDFPPALPLPQLLPSTRFDPQLLQVRAMTSSPKASSQLSPDFVMAENFTQLDTTLLDHAAVKSSVLPRLRMLRAVVERLPKHFTPYKHEPSYKLTYYVERLSCGHERIYYPQAGPMSKRRFCSDCAKSASLPPKKPCSEIVTEAPRHAAKRG